MVNKCLIEAPVVVVDLIVVVVNVVVAALFVVTDPLPNFEF